MGYEAREDARNDYNAEIANEARREAESELEGAIPDMIEAGEYDRAVCLRAAELCKGKGLLGMFNMLKRWAEATSK